MNDLQSFDATRLDELTIHFTLADMAIGLETSRMLLCQSATVLENKAADKVELGAIAKRYVTDTCFDVADKALQLQGTQVWSGEDRPLYAWAPNSVREQRDHASGHRSR